LLQWHGLQSQHCLRLLKLLQEIRLFYGYAI